MRQLELRRDALRVHSSVLRRRVGVDSGSIAESLAPAERAALAARRAVRSPLFVAGAIVIAVWLGPRRLLRLASRVAVGVAILRRLRSLTRAIR